MKNYIITLLLCVLIVGVIAGIFLAVFFIKDKITGKTGKNKKDSDSR